MLSTTHPAASDAIPPESPGGNLGGSPAENPGGRGTPPFPSALFGFLAMAIAIVGLTGLFATFAAPLPLQRAAAREAAFDQALLAASGADPTTALAALRPALGDSADAVLGTGTPDPGQIAARVAQERPLARARLLAEANAVSMRLRLMLCVVTVMAAAFAAPVLRAAARARG